MRGLGLWGLGLSDSRAGWVVVFAGLGVRRSLVVKCLHSPKLTWNPIKPPFKRTVVFIGPFLVSMLVFGRVVVWRYGIAVVA